MKDFKDFMKTLDADFYANMEKTLNLTPKVINAPSTGARIHCESIIISMTLIGMYHKRLTEQLP